MAGTIVVDRIESDASYTSTINVANRITFSNTVNFGVFAGTAPVAGFYLPTTNNLAFTTASTERMRIASDGNVGIGTTSLTTSGGYTSLSINNATNSGYLILQNNGTPKSDWYVSGGTVATLRGVAVPLVLAATGANYLSFENNSTERARIDSSGNLGIGTTSPARRLESRSVGGVQLRAAYDTANYIDIGHMSSTTGGVINSVGDATVNRFLAIQLDGSEKTRIDSNGNLLVGTTSSINAAAYINLRVNPATRWAIATQALVTNSYNVGVFFNLAGTDVGTIVAGASSTSYNTTSDYRLKENIAPMTGALTKIANLKPVTYKWKENGFDGEGFIAHELQEVVPNCVTGNKDAVDADGKPQYQGIDTSFLVATLTAAIQEQQALITQLQADVAALKGA